MFLQYVDYCVTMTVCNEKPKTRDALQLLVPSDETESSYDRFCLLRLNLNLSRCDTPNSLKTKGICQPTFLSLYFFSTVVTKGFKCASTQAAKYLWSTLVSFIGLSRQKLCWFSDLKSIQCTDLLIIGYFLYIVLKVDNVEYVVSTVLRTVFVSYLNGLVSWKSCILFVHLLIFTLQDKYNICFLFIEWYVIAYYDLCLVLRSVVHKICPELLRGTDKQKFSFSVP